MRIDPELVTHNIVKLTFGQYWPTRDKIEVTTLLLNIDTVRLACLNAAFRQEIQIINMNLTLVEGLGPEDVGHASFCITKKHEYHYESIFSTLLC